MLGISRTAEPATRDRQQRLRDLHRWMPVARSEVVIKPSVSAVIIVVPPRPPAL